MVKEISEKAYLHRQNAKLPQKRKNSLPDKFFAPLRTFAPLRCQRVVFSNGVRKIFLITLFVLSVQNFLFAAPLESLKTESNKLATNFTLLDLENKQFSLFDFKGKPILLFFWTTWCPFCRRELKVLNEMHASLTKDGISVLAIDIGESPLKVNNFIKNYGLAFKVLLDLDTQVAQSYEILGVPTYILIDKKGYIVFEDYYFPKKEYKKLISK